MSGPAPGETAVGGVLETCLYHDPSQTAAIERFYGETLGLALVSRWPGGMAFRAGTGVLLLFDRAELARRDGPISAHGTVGPGHACLLAGGEDEYERWKSRLSEIGVAVTHEHEWPRQRRSIYFADPAGNLLEIADDDLWPVGS
jgi:catechol 2,3-dioxygenase-like lactoylglutathione lyase family enzyme